MDVDAAFVISGSNVLLSEQFLYASATALVAPAVQITKTLLTILL